MMNLNESGGHPPPWSLPEHRDLYYGGGWHAPLAGGYETIFNPGSGEPLARVGIATAADAEPAVSAAKTGFRQWRDTPPLERAAIMRAIAAELRRHAGELAMLDAADCGNPVREMGRDGLGAAALFEFFAGLVTELKGASIPMGPDAVNFSVRQPLGVVARIVAFNHPLLFAAGKTAAPLAAGNAVIIKPPRQAPLSALRLAEIIGGMLPPGVFSVLPGDIEIGNALTAHKDIAMVGLVGSVPTGRNVMAAGAARLKPVLLELGGKNALIAYGDTDPAMVARGIVDGMNFTWCGQSCGSTSRAFVHRDIYDEVLRHVERFTAAFVPGLPTDPATTMGAIISDVQHKRILSYIDEARQQGARLICGGGVPGDPLLRNGFYIEPTVFADVTPAMRIAREEIFGPVLAVLPWQDEQDMLRQVNELDYGLTCSIWSNDLEKAHRAAQRVDAGFIWINDVGKHFIGAPFGGVKQSGIGREECLGEMLSFTSEKNIHISLRHVAAKE
ncbi:aldehyde dehydrogenase family protein [Sodalis ligni]|uniref:Acyl-CoA reductase-like NAD-dependent aldehyde dehydrogenase n=1 Tax=Sodalis ligni TaxID=2697027 RepID=A0A4R1NI67_9GAMM|nr:aldehyde dehydrogenase family protein [Sodalis ligni]TCL07455.1 acyl-CoA reductase-like NAD-dependent aldehyde dehydrogenase [Sodalis ligni]